MPQSQPRNSNPIRDGYPVGQVRLWGRFFEKHREEVLRLVRNEEERERSRHPLQRIMVMRDGPAQADISTTDVYVARRIGEALKHAFQGALEVRYSRGESFVRVKWTRD